MKPINGNQKNKNIRKMMTPWEKEQAKPAPAIMPVETMSEPIEEKKESIFSKAKKLLK